MTDWLRPLEATGQDFCSEHALTGLDSPAPLVLLPGAELDPASETQPGDQAVVPRCGPGSLGSRIEASSPGSTHDWE